MLGIMVRNYERKTSRGACPNASSAALFDYKNNMKMKVAAKKHGLDRMTLTRHTRTLLPCMD